MRNLMSAVACAALASLVCSGAAEARDYSGKYRSKITLASGAVSRAVVTIKKVDETIFSAESKADGFVEMAICFGEEERLSCGFASKSGTRYIGASIYVPDETGRLIGKWVDNLEQKQGKEVLTPVD